MGAAPPPRALFLCEDPPVSGLSGASSYNHTILGALRDLGIEVEVLVTSPRLQSLAARARATPLVERFSYLHAVPVRGRVVPVTARAVARQVKSVITARRPRRDSGATRRAVLGRRLTRHELAAVRRRAARARYDLLVLDTVFRADALDQVAASQKILVAHDIFAARAQSFSANGFEVVNPVSADSEVAVWSAVDSVVAISEADARMIRRRTSTRTTAVLPVVPGAADPTADDLGEDVLYVGAAAYHNVDGLEWFLDEVWPAVRADHPRARLHVVGGVCEAVAPGVPGVVLHGRVDDLGAVAGECRLAVNPVRMGSGLKIKMVDYFRLGLPCVVTPIGAEGFPSREEQPYVVTTSAHEMARTVTRLLAHRDAAQLLRRSIPDYVGLFSPESARTALAAVVDLVAAPASSAGTTAGTTPGTSPGTVT